jgi:predicted  nucleic acid-binding Zn-ribbon protein
MKKTKKTNTTEQKLKDLGTKSQGLTMLSEVLDRLELLQEEMRAEFISNADAIDDLNRQIKIISDDLNTVNSNVADLTNIVEELNEVVSDAVADSGSDEDSDDEDDDSDDDEDVDPDSLSDDWSDEEEA